MTPKMKALWNQLWNLPPEVLGGIAIVSVCSLLFGIVAVPWSLARIPHDYFLTHQEYLTSWKTRRPILRIVVLVIRNFVGVILALLGIVMLVTPGQGLITLLLGITLTTFPGKRVLELNLLRRRGVLQTINWLRARSNRRPLVIPQKPSGREKSEVCDE